MINCPNCGQPNNEELTFCESCGSPLSGSPVVVAPTIDVTPEEAPIVGPNPEINGEKKKKTGLIIGIIAGVVAIIAILIIVLLPTILRGALGETKYYLMREYKYMNKQYSLSDISLNKVFGTETKIEITGTEDETEMYLIVDTSKDRSKASVKLMMKVDGEEGTLLSMEAGEEYVTISIPMISEDVYFVNFSTEDINSDSKIANAIVNAFKTVDVENYITAIKVDGKTVEFNTNDARLYKYIDAIIAELNKNDDYVKFINENFGDEESIINVLNGTEKLGTEDFDEDYMSAYKYRVVYQGRKGIESREFFVDDESVFKISKNDNNDAVITVDEATISITNYKIEKTAGGNMVPTFNLLIGSDDENCNVIASIVDKTYKITANYDDTSASVLFTKVKDIDDVKITAKDKCKELNEDTISELIGTLMFGGMDIDYSDYEDYDFSDYESYNIDEYEYDFDY